MPNRRSARARKCWAVLTALCAALLPAAAGAAEAGKSPDLDVLFIKRLPAYRPGPWLYPLSGPQYLADPATGRPLTAEQLRTTHKQHPDAGEKVEFTAVVANKSDAACGAFAYEWTLDGKRAAAGTIAGLAPWRRVEVKLPWKWDPARHTVGLRVDPANKLAEACEVNNELTDFTDALSLQMRITPELYKAFDAKRNKLGSRSFEDWVQRHVKIMNGVFAGCRYPGMFPKGIRERVRVQEVVQMTKKEMARLPQTFGCDGGWNFYDDNFPAWFDYHIKDDFTKRIDTGLIHELTHQVGIIDMYCIVVGGHWNHVRDADGQPVFIAYSTRQPGMMGGGGPLVDFDGKLVESLTFTPRADGSVDVGTGKTFAAYAPETVGALNRLAGLRRGHFGLYLFDLPKISALRILNNRGKPAAGVSVRVFQQSPYPGPQSIPEKPTMSGRTSKAGIMTLGSAPFGNINTIGLNGILFFEIRARGHTEYRFLDVSYFNIAAWTGCADYWLATLKTSVPPEGAPKAPANLRWGLLKHRAKPLLRWDAAAGAVAYNVYRQRTYGKEDRPWGLSVTFDSPYVKFAAVPAAKTSMEIKPIPGYAGAQDQPHFTVTAVDAQGRESGHARTKEVVRWGPYPRPNVIVKRDDPKIVEVTLGPGAGAVQVSNSFVVERGTRFAVRYKTISQQTSAFRLTVAGLGKVQIPLTGEVEPPTPALGKPRAGLDGKWHELSVDLRPLLDELARKKKTTPARHRTTWNDAWLVTACSFGNWGAKGGASETYSFRNLRIGK